MRTSQLAAIFLISIVITLCYQQAEAQTYYFATPLDGEVFTEGIDLEVIVNASHPDGIKNVRLYLDEVHIRKESVDPYRWHSGQDPALAAMSAGDYTLRALITTKLDETAVMSIGITIGEIVEPSEPPAPPDPPQGPCELCFGWDVDVAIDNDTIQSCVTWATTATEHEVVYEDGPSHIEVGCLVEIAIFPEVRVHVRARQCGDEALCPWSEFGPWARSLTLPEEERFTCHGDFDYNGTVNGDDFVVFRKHFLKGDCL